MRTFVFSLALIVISACSAPTDISLQFKQAWVQEGPPNARVLAGFMQIHNPSDQTVMLTGATSKQFGHIEFHQSIIEGGMARMHKQESFNIAANKTLELKHGGYHLMLFKPAKVFKPGDQVEIVFTTKAGKSYTQKLPVKSPGASMHGHEHHHH